MKKTRCKRGHLIAEVGRDPANRTCRACLRESKRAARLPRIDRSGCAPTRRGERLKLDPEPFRQWLIARLFDETQGQLAKRLELPQERISQVLHRPSMVHIDTVDRALVSVGEQLMDLYPELYA